MSLNAPFSVHKTARFAVLGLEGDAAGATAAAPAAAAANAAGDAGGDADALQAAVVRQGVVVKSLKKAGGDPAEIAKEVAVLQQLKAQLEAALASGGGAGQALDIDRVVLNDMLLQRMFVVPSFEIHGGVAGLFDLGPPACAVKSNLLELWRRHFILHDNMLQMECTNLTPHAVLKTSGHVDRFTDMMVRDLEEGTCYRADHLLEDAIEALLDANPTMPVAEREAHERIMRQADAFSAAELGAQLSAYGVTAPETGNAISDPFPFNLMFQTQIGPTESATSVGYLRPETAQGLFVNFARLNDYNAGKMPFAAAQIGYGFRNEIAPRQGLLRVREFCMAEIEHFVNPKDKSHERFALVRDQELCLFSAESQMGDGKKMRRTVGEAVSAGLIDNETLGYFLARTQQFCEAIGLDKEKIMFRQHLPTEMAHYASDCWDLEVLTSYGWIECAGHADRACYDLEVHAKATGKKAEAEERFSEPREVEVSTVKTNNALIGKTFKKDQKAVKKLLEELSGAALDAFMEEMGREGKAKVGAFELSSDMVEIAKAKKMVQTQKFTPSVIEPSFGIGRILYALFEHSFYQREQDAQRIVMRFNPAMAPVKLHVLPLSSNSAFAPHVNRIADALRAINVAYKIDASGAAVGRRYARGDELGIPFAATVDFDTAPTNTVTLRERDSCAQVRVSIDQLVALMPRLCDGSATWEDHVLPKFPLVHAGDDAQEPDAAAPTRLQSLARGIRFTRPNPSLIPTL